MRGQERKLNNYSTKEYEGVKYIVKGERRDSGVIGAGSNDHQKLNNISGRKLGTKRGVSRGGHI